MESIDEKVTRLESQLLEQEHRPFTLIKNFIGRKKWDRNDTRRDAVKVALLWRLLFSPTAVAITGGFIGFVSLIFIYHQSTLIGKQNELIENQNLLFESQNKRIEQQTHLLEADRRSSQIFIMGEVLQDIGKELAFETNIDRKLSGTLLGRISSLVEAMKPYRYLDGDSLITKPISPERGQILKAVLSSRMDKTQFEKEIISGGNFSFAELRNVDFSKLNFLSVTMNNSDLQNSNFRYSDLSFSNVSNSELSGSSFFKSLANELIADNCNFSNVRAKESQFFDSEFAFSNFEHFAFYDGLFKNCFLNNADFSNSILVNSSFEGSDCSSCIFGGALIFNTDFTRTDLTYSNFHGAIVQRADWIEYMRDSVLTIKLRRKANRNNSKGEKRSSSDISIMSNYKLVDIKTIGSDYDSTGGKYVISHKDSSLNSLRKVLGNWKITR